MTTATPLPVADLETFAWCAELGCDADLHSLECADRQMERAPDEYAVAEEREQAAADARYARAMNE